MLRDYVKATQKNPPFATFCSNEGIRLDGRGSTGHPPHLVRGGLPPRTTRLRHLSPVERPRASPRSPWAPRTMSSSSTTPSCARREVPCFTTTSRHSQRRGPPIRGTSRREIGHGNLALRALKPMLPPVDDCPYTIRLVSEILESNGSSSMATVCCRHACADGRRHPHEAPGQRHRHGPHHRQETGKYAVLSDILGDEDHLGDMDFKVDRHHGRHHSLPDGHQDQGTVLSPN